MAWCEITFPSFWRRLSKQVATGSYALVAMLCATSVSFAQVTALVKADKSDVRARMTSGAIPAPAPAPRPRQFDCDFLLREFPAIARVRTNLNIKHQVLQVEVFDLEREVTTVGFLNLAVVVTSDQAARRRLILDRLVISWGALDLLWSEIPATLVKDLKRDGFVTEIADRAGECLENERSLAWKGTGFRDANHYRAHSVKLRNQLRMWSDIFRVLNSSTQPWSYEKGKPFQCSDMEVQARVRSLLKKL